MQLNCSRSLVARSLRVYSHSVSACTPQEWQDSEELLDGSHVVGASRGNIEGSGVGGVGIGTLLQVGAESAVDCAWHGKTVRCCALTGRAIWTEYVTQH